MVIGLIVAFGIIVLLDLPVLFKTNNKPKTLLIYFFLIASGFTISLLHVSGNQMLNPSKVIEKMIKLII